MKKCCRCKEELPLSVFGRNKSKKDGYQTACKPCKRAYSKERYSKNPDKHKEQCYAWGKNNPETVASIQSRYRKRSAPKINARNAARRAGRAAATPEWLTPEQHDDMKSMYILAKKWGDLFSIDYHVDHIVPLNGENICGLHVPWNLQLLEAKLNLSKSNNF